MYLAASVFSAVLLRKVYQFQTLPDFEQYRVGSIIDFLYYSLPFGIAFTVKDTLILGIWFTHPLLLRWSLHKILFDIEKILR